MPDLPEYYSGQNAAALLKVEEKRTALIGAGHRLTADDLDTLLADLDTFEATAHASPPARQIAASRAAHASPLERIAAEIAASRAARETPARPAPCDKVGGSRPRKSLVADRETICATRDYARSPDAPSEMSSYIRGTTTHTPSPSPDDTPSLYTPSPDDTPIDDEDLLSPLSPKKPKAWRDTGEHLRSTYIGRALEARGCSFKEFTLRLDPTLIENSAHPLDDLHRRMRDHLKRRLGRAPDLAFIPEYTEDGELHIHGWIAIDDEQLPKAKEALRVAGGKWREGKASARQSQFDHSRGADGWARYMCKSLRATQDALGRHIEARQGNRRRPPSLIICSALLRREAETLYEHERERLIQKRRSVRAEPLESPLSFTLAVPAIHTTQTPAKAASGVPRLATRLPVCGAAPSSCPVSTWGARYGPDKSELTC